MPPRGTRLPPTNATAPSPYIAARSPIVSSRKILPAPTLSSVVPGRFRNSLARANSNPLAATIPATAANRSGCRGASTITARGSSPTPQATPPAASSPHPPACSHRPPPSHPPAAAPEHLCQRTLPPTRTSYFKFPVTFTRSAGAPIFTSRSAVSSLCARNREIFPSKRPPQPPQPHIPRKRPIRDPRIHHRHRHAVLRALVDQPRPKLALHQPAGICRWG